MTLFSTRYSETIVTSLAKTPEARMRMYNFTSFRDIFSWLPQEYLLDSMACETINFISIITFADRRERLKYEGNS